MYAVVEIRQQKSAQEEVGSKEIASTTQSDARKFKFAGERRQDEQRAREKKDTLEKRCESVRVSSSLRGPIAHGT